MRVLRTNGSDNEHWTPCLCTHRGQPYAVLSHRWLENPNHEVLFADIEEVDRTVDTSISTVQDSAVRNALYVGAHPAGKPGFQKLQNAARQALQDGFDFIWIDTCCIDKGSSADLSEAINSMWTWYAAATICYAYLADVPDSTNTTEGSNFAQSQWWTRGWTLQELLAPRALTFFSSTWTIIGHKTGMDLEIAQITKISPNVINGTVTLDSISIAQRMSWISARITTRAEDMAYCLLGIFGVNMPLLYGEGEKAFLRLQQEIMQNSDDETIFAWRDEAVDANLQSGLLAMRPAAFALSHQVVHYADSEHRTPYSMTNKGLSITLPLNPVQNGLFVAKLHCTDPAAVHKNIAIYLRKTSESSEQYARVHCGEWAQFAATPQTKAMSVYIKQFHDQQPAYRPLDEHHSRIRLFRIVPTEDALTVKIRLIEADLETSRYTALSHVWGDQTQRRTVWVNSQPLLVNANIFYFLQKARETPTNELFWVYGICIQIYDVREKNRQVSIVGQIFRRASKVVIWLGGVDTDLDRLRWLGEEGAVTQVSSAASITQQSKRQQASDADFIDHLSSLTSIASHPYWRRLWIVQEILSAQDVDIQLEAFSITITELTQIFDCAVLEASHRSLVTESLSHMGRLLKRFQAKLRAPYWKPIEFELLLMDFWPQQTQDPRDRVYGLIGISNLAQKLQIDYTLSPIGLFFNVVDALSEDLPLSILTILLVALNINTESQRVRDGSDHDVAHPYELRPIHFSTAIAGYLPESAQSRCLITRYASYDEHIFLSIVHTTFPAHGLVFSGPRRSHEESQTPTTLRLSHTFARDWSNPGTLMALPSKVEQRLTQTYATLDESDPEAPILRITADRNGLLALGRCMQPPVAPDTPPRASRSRTKHTSRWI